MDFTRLLNMLLRMFMNKAIHHGIDYAARRGKREADLTPEERAQAQQARDLAKRARKVARITGRLGR